ncbi:LysR family transcriptional regulator [Paraglaciecola polaris]|uniref:Transcriptional regulator, LysR family n=1 Tax=Paraglaciecola polaris LMG 21857 TaxID=1129793 RepID=K7AIE4_9ALTE|nr:LysR substrate-binding domain-containing protein [Paraglaciecola polaris]GAC35025.1 transcriptional regulator, LysR family [Paraglaciecola polaris LMG 21857]|tara:strand:- start:9156 stop:10061 length:906 start_codon:yes stop_codon:yes gene_type:complete
MDRITSLQSFVEVARCGSFTKAAEHIGLSRLQVTRHVQDIEQWLALRLFHRTTRKVSLTLQGEEALEFAQHILSSVSELESRAHSHNHELVGSIRVATPIGLGQHLLFDAIEQFVAVHPKTQIQMVLSDGLSQLVDERVDIALRYIDQPHQQLIARRLMHIDNVLCASPAYIHQHASLEQPSDLLAHNCLVHSNSAQWRIVSATSDEKITVKGNIQANEMGVVLKAALRGLGVANLPCDLANRYLLSNELCQVLPNYYAPGHNLWAVYLSRDHQQNVVRAFIDFLALRWQDDVHKVQQATS